MRKISLILLYAGSFLMIMAGTGDQFIRKLLNVHLQYLGNPNPSEFLNQAERLIILMLHAIGGGLLSAGISMLALVHFAVRKDQSWALWTVLIIAWIAQGFNGYGMWKVNSYYSYPVLIILVTTIGVILFRKKA